MIVINNAKMVMLFKTLLSFYNMELLVADKNKLISLIINYQENTYKYCKCRNLTITPIHR